MLPGFSQRADLLVRPLLQDCALAMNFNHFIRGGFEKTLMCIFKIIFFPFSLALKDDGCNAFYEGNNCEKGTYNSGFLVFSDFIKKLDIQLLEFLLPSECNFGNCSVNEAV